MDRPPESARTYGHGFWETALMPAPESPDGVVPALLDRLEPGLFRLRRTPDGQYGLEGADATLRRQLGLGSTEPLPGFRDWLGWIPDDHVQQMLERLEHSARDLSLWSHEWLADPPAGRRAFHAIAAPEAQPDASVVWDGFLFDVTEPRRREAQADPTDTDYRSVFENTTEGIFRSTPEGRLLDVNWPLVKIHGCRSKEELIAAVGNIADDWYVDPADRDRIVGTLERDGYVERFESEIRCVCTGERIRTEENVRVVYGADGRVLYYQGTVRDITQEYRRRRLAARRSHLLERIARGDPLTEVLYDAVGALEDFGQHLTAAVLRMEEDALRVAAAPALANDCIAALESKRPSTIGGAVAAAVHSAEKVVGSQVGLGQGAFTAAMADAGYGEIVALPLRDREGAVLGILTAFLRDATEVDSELKALLHEMAQIVAIALEQHALTVGLVRQAQHDALTQLPNRDLLADRVQQLMLDAGRNDYPLAVLLLDIDEFKRINDTFGHADGDILLREMAARLQSSVRGTDTVARLGGDEFVVAVPVERAGCAELVAERIIAAMADPFRIRGQMIAASTSIGIAVFPQDGLTLDHLLQAADAAMYAAKHGGKNQYRYFNEGLSEAVSERLQLEAALLQAIEREELLAYYRPRFDLASGRLTAAETVLRWQHPERGVLADDTFAELTARSTLECDLDRYRLRRALEEGERLVAAGSDLRLSVALCDRSLQAEGIARELAARIGPARAAYIEIAVPEQAVGHGLQRMRAVLYELRERLPEIRIALDHFGRADSSLRYLTDLPLDVVKLDAALVARLGEAKRESHAATVIRAVCELARALDLRVVADGLATAAQAEEVTTLNCCEVQGPYCSDAVTGEALLASDRA